MTSLILFLLLSTVIFSILLYVFVFLESGIMTTFRYPRVRSAGNVITSHLNFFKTAAQPECHFHTKSEWIKIQDQKEDAINWKMANIQCMQGELRTA